MNKIDFDKYDTISETERLIEMIIMTYNLKSAIITLTQEEDLIKYILTIISILYKQKCYHQYLEENIRTLEEDEIDLLYEIIEKIKEKTDQKDYKEALLTIKQHGFIIQQFLEQYYSKKNTNYISKKHTMEIVISQNNQKELLEYNPFCINQVLEYMQEPLTKEELMIQEIIEYLVEAQQLYTTQNEILNYIKELMQKNNKDEQLEKIILFMISNVYQEIIENPIDENKNIIIPIVENQKINKQEIIKHFNRSNAFSNMIIQTFITYNLEIKNGRLKELETKESKIYARKLYNK